MKHLLAGSLGITDTAPDEGATAHPVAGRRLRWLMPDAIFAHPVLARVYDAFDGNRADLDLSST